jgi:hypothetical protein
MGLHVLVDTRLPRVLLPGRVPLHQELVPLLFSQ